MATRDACESNPLPLLSTGLAWPGLAWPGLARHRRGAVRSYCGPPIREPAPTELLLSLHLCATPLRYDPSPIDHPLSPPLLPSTPLLSMSPPSSANFSTLLTFSQWMETVFRGREGEGRREKNRKHFRKQSTFRGGALFFLFPSLFFSLFSDLRRGWGEGGFVDWRIFGSLLCFLSEGMK